jgi:tRNA dimethylallyltransferase
MRATGKYVKDADALWIGLSPPRKTLYQRISDRVDEMIKAGFEKEVQGLSPFIETIRRKKMIGYVDLIEYIFDKKINRETAIQRIKQHHRNYAKRQLTWFRKLKQIAWFDSSQPGHEEKVYAFCEGFFKKA